MTSVLTVVRSIGSAATLAACAFALPLTAYAQTPAVTVNEIKIGAPVFGSEGIKVGEINRIKADAAGRVTELQVTTGGPAGLNAEVVAITPDKIAVNDKSSVKLSVSAGEARKLPALTEDQKG